MDIEINCLTGEITQTETPRPSLDDEKASKWLTVKSERGRQIDAGCLVPNIGTFDTDLESRLNISGAVSGALAAIQLNQAYSIQWKLADNSIVTLDAQQMIMVGMTVLSRISACHYHSQSLSEQIQSASSYLELDAIDIYTGWPA